jgi:cobalt-zinc-cadmium efflux system protein
MPENDENEYTHDHQHGLSIQLRTMPYKRLWWALIINLVFLGIEIIGGILTNSLALLADAGHMLTDVAALALALFVAHIVQRPATPDRTYGLLRAEVLGAFVNGAMLVFVVGLIFWEAWKRLGQTIEVDGPFMLLVAFFGLLANLGSAMILAKGIEENVNVRGAFLHMIADALGSVGVIVAGVVIWTTAWYPVDPIASMVIGFLILWSSWGFLKQTMNILLEATPEDISFMEVKRALEEMEHIEKVHDLHIWDITSGMPVLTAHLYLSSCCTEANHWRECLGEAQRILRERFGIEHTTLQVEASDPSGSTECLFTEDN